MSKLDTTEKITININTVDLGLIDLLVSEGYYATRTELIKTAIKSQLEKHEEDSKHILARKADHGYEWGMGIGGFTKEQLETRLKKGLPKIQQIFIGVFVIPDTISVDLLLKTVSSIKVFGISRCSTEIKEVYQI